MNPSNVYNLCCQHHGKVVRIRCRDGSVHVGEITRVDRDMVWIRPRGNMGGYGLGFGLGGPGFGFNTPFFGFRRRRVAAFGIGIALGTIIGIGLASAFLW
ncbi:hypothetical protein [Rummeliibacillus pycnus]|uniref:hypothetical protein n=1 Tax=Rummeliibacillus pycnus TaxID=101070 RepID=UPI0037CBF8CA